jgi:GMP synthase (glutamine-hydrolysing)
LRSTDYLLDIPEYEPTIVMTHLDSVVKLPPGAEVLCQTELDPHAGLRFSSTTWGVQFHPEMDEEIVGYYLTERRADIESEGLDVEAILAARRRSAFGAQILRRFADFCLSQETPTKTP